MSHKPKTPVNLLFILHFKAAILQEIFEKPRAIRRRPTVKATVSQTTEQRQDYNLFVASRQAIIYRND